MVVSFSFRRDFPTYLTMNLSCSFNFQVVMEEPLLLQLIFGCQRSAHLKTMAAVEGGLHGVRLIKVPLLPRIHPQNLQVFSNARLYPQVMDY